MNEDNTEQKQSSHQVTKIIFDKIERLPTLEDALIENPNAAQIESSIRELEATQEILRKTSQSKKDATR